MSNEQEGMWKGGSEAQDSLVYQILQMEKKTLKDGLFCVFNKERFAELRVVFSLHPYTMDKN